MEKRRDEPTGIHDNSKLDQTSDFDGSRADVQTCVSVVTCCYGFNNEHKGCGRLQHRHIDFAWDRLDFKQKRTNNSASASTRWTLNINVWNRARNCVTKAGHPVNWFQRVADSALYQSSGTRDQWEISGTIRFPSVRMPRWIDSEMENN